MKISFYECKETGKRYTYEAFTKLWEEIYKEDEMPKSVFVQGFKVFYK